MLDTFQKYPLKTFAYHITPAQYLLLYRKKMWETFLRKVEGERKIGRKAAIKLHVFVLSSSKRQVRYTHDELNEALETMPLRVALASPTGATSVTRGLCGTSAT